MADAQEASRRIKLTNYTLLKYFTRPSDGVKQSTFYDAEIPGFGVYRNVCGPARSFVHFRVGSRLSLWCG